MTKANDMVKVAVSQIGYKESPANSNKTKYGKWFGMNGVPWCAIFLDWCFEQAKGGSLFPHNPSAAYAQDEIVSSCKGTWVMKKNTSRSTRRAYLAQAKPGDVVTFDFGKMDAYRRHIGIVERVSGSDIICIEGNTSKSGSQSNGGMVCRQTRPYTYICAAARPAYSDAVKPVKPTPDPVTKPLQVDGIMGYQTVCRLQKWLGTSVDGEIGPNTVRALQKKVGAKPIDGKWGKNTSKKFQKYLNQHGAKLDVDGIFGKASVKALQTYLNKVYSDKPTPKPTPKSYPKCIDVSEHQGNINWSKVKAAGINYAILRAGYGKGNTDKHFIKNISEATKAGIKVGVYWFSYAYTNDMAIKEAEFCIKAIGKYKVDLPVFFDFEYDSTRYAKEKGVNPSKALVTSMHKAFCSRITSAGFKAGFYYNFDYKKNHIDMSQLKPYYHWYALYDTSDKQTDCFAQQYTSKGKVDGIAGNVDMNWIFGDVTTPAPKPTPAPKKGYSGTFPNLDNLAPDLIAGMARKLAWPYGTKESKYKYPSGSATSAFNSAIAKVFPNRSGWREQCRKGASCDVFVGTVVRASGHDTGFPRGLSDVYGHVRKKPALWKVINKPDLKAGDVVEWGTSSAGHIFVCTGEHREAEANLNGKHYGHISKIYVPSHPKTYRAYRPVGGRKYLIQGDSCVQVGYLQMFLNWCIDSRLVIDCDFGGKTADAVRAFQKKYALTPDGLFGTASLMKAKAVKK